MPARRRRTPVHVTAREAEVLDLLSQGFGDAEIGETIGIATGTVKGYIGRLAEKLQVNSDITGHRILLAKFWKCPIFRLGAGWDDHHSMARSRPNPGPNLKRVGKKGEGSPA